MKKILLPIALIWVGHAAVLATEAQWKAGAASIAITPELPMWMSGYGARTKPAEAVAAPLYAKALALEDDAGHTVVIVTSDLLGIPRILRQAVEKEVQRRYGLSPERLLLNASHTHCGPELRGVRTSLNDLDPARSEQVATFQAQTVERLVEVIGRALGKREPAQVSFGKARCGFAMNRRSDYSLWSADFGYDKKPNPWGPVDHDVPVLVVTGGEKNLRALLFGYACHNTTSGDNAFHGDYAGFAQARLEETYPGVVALFMAGCGGDQNPYPRGAQVPGKTAIDLARRHGQTLATAVEAAMNAHPRPLSGRIAGFLEEVALPYLPPPSREELEQRLLSTRQADRDYATVLLEIWDRDGQLPTSYPYPIQVIGLGELTLIGLASEAVVDYSLRLKRELPPRSLWVAAYCNDFMGYIPSLRVWQEGDYEGGGAMNYRRETMYRVVHPHIWDSPVEELIIGKVHELYQRLKGDSP